MLLIHLVEKEMGPILTWPTYILCYLFMDVPNAGRVEELSGFFFGNGLPYGLAWRLYKAANPTETGAALDIIFDSYSMWRNSWNTPHISVYYNMCIGRFSYINGAFLDQLEPARPGLTVKEFGLENTGCSTLIKFMSNKVRTIEV
jgi:hypothetical protein